MHACSSEGSTSRREPARASSWRELSASPPGAPQTLRSHDWGTISDDAQLGKAPGELADRGRRGATLAPTPSPPARRSKTTSRYIFAVTRQWATRFMFSFKFYSQCALTLSYTTATWDGSERLVTCLQHIKTQGFRALLGASCPVDQKWAILF